MGTAGGRSRSQRRLALRLRRRLSLHLAHHLRRQLTKLQASRVPHPCAFFLAQGWETPALNRPQSEANSTDRRASAANSTNAATCTPCRNKHSQSLTASPYNPMAKPLPVNSCPHPLGALPP